jgi:type I restriction-modification system DNA methylase subunit
MINLLEHIDYKYDDGNYVTGLVPLAEAEFMPIQIDERAAVKDACLFNSIDYIFFRRFIDRRSSQIAAYIVDNSDSHLNNDQLAELHGNVWMQGTVPLLYIVQYNRIDLLACARKPDFWLNDDYQYNPFCSIITAGEINSDLSSRKYSLKRLADGTFWDDPSNSNLVDYSRASHKKLIEAVVDADKQLDGENNSAIRRLLLLMILIKYLEDRDVFPVDFFNNFCSGAKRFEDVLHSRSIESIRELLNYLEHEKFNGDVFSFENESLSEDQLIHFATFIEAQTKSTGQRYLWKQYSFKFLPVEVISHIYQRFVSPKKDRQKKIDIAEIATKTKATGAVYTPPFLASLLLDQVMPYSTLTGHEKILDPSCGSGIFLVGAFRRLINVWRSNNEWKQPDVISLKAILRHSIFGVELEPFAVDLTVFSLCLALCDALQPHIIWNQLRFDKLRNENIIQNDFFSVYKELVRYPQWGKTFDIVIGNPPFKSKLSKDADDVVKMLFKDKKICKRDIPDKQIAYLFLLCSLEILGIDGRVCLIQPQGFLYNSGTEEMRTDFIRNHRIDIIFDFSSIRPMYDGADKKTIAVLAFKQKPENDNIIKHWTFRRTVSVKERMYFELDYYDRHNVTQEIAENNPSVWRVNFIGGSRLHYMSQRLKEMRSLNEYIEHKMRCCGWNYGEGFVVGNKSTEAKFITNHNYLPPESLTETGIAKKEFDKIVQTHFEDPRNENRYTPPLILIREIDSLPLELWTKSYLTYNNQIVGIHAPLNEVDELGKLYNYLCSNKDVLRFSFALHSSRYLVDKNTSLLKNDIDLLPYPENTDTLNLTYWEQVLCEDVVNYMTRYVCVGQESALLKESAKPNHLYEYSELFVKLLNTIYPSIRAANPIYIDNLICQSFYFGDKEDVDLLYDNSTKTKNALNSLIYETDEYASLRTIRIIRYYEKNLLLLIKPNRLRYWIRSIAIRDADETLADLYKWGY